MKTRLLAVAAALVAALAAALKSDAQHLHIDSIESNMSLTYWGARFGTTATVEWAHGSDPTNWYPLSTQTVETEVVSTPLPMLFRVLGVPDTNLLNGLIADFPLDGNMTDVWGR